MEYPRIDALLLADVSCARNSLVLLKLLRPSVPDIFESAADLFQWFSSAFARSGYEKPLAVQFENCAKEMGISPRELDSLIESDDANPLVCQARLADRALIARQAQKYAFQLAWRAFRWGSTDLRRLRVTAAYGYMRQQAEAMGLMVVFNEDRDFARRWLSATENHRTLFFESRAKAKDAMEQFDLKFIYDHASGMAMHATFAAGVSASKFGSTVDHIVIEIGDQEFNPADPFIFHLAVAYFLRIQERCFGALPQVCPDLQRDESTGRVATFKALVEDVWWTLTRKYQDRILAMQQAVSTGTPRQAQAK